MTDNDALREAAQARWGAAEPTDGREPQQCPKCGQMCRYDGWGHVHPDGLGIGSCPVVAGAVTADAREKLAAALFRGGADNYDVALDLLLPVVDEIAGKRAAEVEAERDYWKTEAIELTSMMPPRADGMDAEAGVNKKQ